MARLLVESVIKERIKANKAIMNENKKIVSDNLKLGSKLDEEYDVSATRMTLALFSRAVVALQNDTAKLQSMKEDKENGGK